MSTVTRALLLAAGAGAAGRLRLVRAGLHREGRFGNVLLVNGETAFAGTATAGAGRRG